MTETDEPSDDDATGDNGGLEDEAGSAAPVPGLGAVGQMIAALLVVVGLVALFIGVAAALRRLLP